jgi:2-keto-3-deoxy-L-rhamnonate aldolase RhmA
MQSLWERRKAGRPLLGTFCGLGSVDAVELACHAGFDFVVLDGQHGSFDARGLREALRAVDAAGGFAVVRLPAHGLAEIEGILDLGCAALLAPMVNTPGQAADLVAAAYYPPLGLRSRSGCRASLREGAAYPETFNRLFSLIVMIEHASALEQVERIAAVPGVAACFVGPTDLAMSLGEPSGGAGQSALAAAVARVRTACAAAGKLAGIAAPDAGAARAYARQGFDFVVAGTDRRLLAAAFETTMAAWRQGEHA